MHIECSHSLNTPKESCLKIKCYQSMDKGNKNPQDTGDVNSLLS